MFKLIYKFLTSPFFKILFKIIASLASAIAVISGYLFFVNMSSKHRQEDTESKEFEEEDEEEDVEE